MRIGTWNLAGRLNGSVVDFLARLSCDVLLLTEVPRALELDGYAGHHTDGEMSPGRSWSAIFSRRALRALPDPHGASAMAEVDGVRFCSSILPWRSSGGLAPWVGDTQGARTAAAVRAIVEQQPAVWGGDWNHAMSRRDYAGSTAGRLAIATALTTLDLQLPTRECPHPSGQRSIDHVAVPRHWQATARPVTAVDPAGRRLSDHDAYVVEAAG